MADCLSPDSPDFGGYGGGSCEGSRCGNSNSKMYTTCFWLWGATRGSVFEAYRECVRTTPDYCADQPATIAACADSVFPKACSAPGATVDGIVRECSDISSTCPGVDEAKCAKFMNVLTDERRQRAYECYFGAGATESNCATTFSGCIGWPG